VDDGGRRLVLNGILDPAGSAIPPTSVLRESAMTAARATAVASPVPAFLLPLLLGQL